MLFALPCDCTPVCFANRRAQLLLNAQYQDQKNSRSQIFRSNNPSRRRRAFEFVLVVVFDLGCSFGLRCFGKAIPAPSIAQNAINDRPALPITTMIALFGSFREARAMLHRSGHYSIVSALATHQAGLIVALSPESLSLFLSS